MFCYTDATEVTIPLRLGRCQYLKKLGLVCKIFISSFSFIPAILLQLLRVVVLHGDTTRNLQLSVIWKLVACSAGMFREVWVKFNREIRAYLEESPMRMVSHQRRAWCPEASQFVLCLFVLIRKFVCRKSYRQNCRKVLWRILPLHRNLWVFDGAFLVALGAEV